MQVEVSVGKHLGAVCTPGVVLYLLSSLFLCSLVGRII